MNLYDEKMSNQVIPQEIYGEKFNPVLTELDEEQTVELIVELMERLGKTHLSKVRDVAQEVIEEMEELNIEQV